MLYALKKFFVAIKDTLCPKSRGGNSPRLIMTLLVKNEEVLLERNLLFHKSQGVDAFIITDNNSTDSTPTIIQKYIDKGWIVESITERGTDYRQKKWVDRMIWSAKTLHGADWVINADADEMWCSPSADLKAEMRGAKNILRSRVVNVYPTADKQWWEWDEVISPIPNIEEYNLSPYSIYNRYTYKVAHSLRGYLKISMGNHKVSMFTPRKAPSEITIYHYNILSRKQFIDKMINGGKQFELNPKKSVGRHWRYFYELYKSEGLDAEYDRVIGVEYLDEYRQKGYIYRDTSVADRFKTIFLEQKLQ